MTDLTGTTTGPDRDAGFVQGALLACVPAMIVMTIVVTVPILPAIMRAFPDQANIEELIPLVAVLPTLVLALTSLAAGALGEMAGRRRLLFIGTAVFAVSAIMPMWLN